MGCSSSHVSPKVIVQVEATPKKPLFKLDISQTPSVVILGVTRTHTKLNKPIDNANKQLLHARSSGDSVMKDEYLCSTQQIQEDINYKFPVRLPIPSEQDPSIPGKPLSASALAQKDVLGGKPPSPSNTDRQARDSDAKDSQKERDLLRSPMSRMSSLQPQNFNSLQAYSKYKEDRKRAIVGETHCKPAVNHNSTIINSSEFPTCSRKRLSSEINILDRIRSVSHGMSPSVKYSPVSSPRVAKRTLQETVYQKQGIMVSNLPKRIIGGKILLTPTPINTKEEKISNIYELFERSGEENDEVASLQSPLSPLQNMRR